jgi:hypothetical protein
MGFGYLLTKDIHDAPDARAVVTFTAGPWKQLISLPEMSLTQSTEMALGVCPGLGPTICDFLYGLPPLPTGNPKIWRPEDDDIVAIVLARLRPGRARRFIEHLTEQEPQGALRLLVPRGYALVDVCHADEETLMSKLDDILDVDHVLDAEVGVALGTDVRYSAPAD